MSTESQHLLKEGLKRMPLEVLREAMAFLKGAVALDPADSHCRACLDAAQLLLDASSGGSVTAPPPPAAAPAPPLVPPPAAAAPLPRVPDVTPPPPSGMPLGTPSAALPAGPLRLDPRFDATISAGAALPPVAPPPPPPEAPVRRAHTDLQFAVGPQVSTTTVTPDESRPSAPVTPPLPAHAAGPHVQEPLPSPAVGAAPPVLPSPAAAASVLPAVGASEQLMNLVLAPPPPLEPALQKALEKQPVIAGDSAWGDGTWANLVGPTGTAPGAASPQAPVAPAVTPAVTTSVGAGAGQAAPPPAAQAGPVLVASPPAGGAEDHVVWMEQARTAQALGDLASAAQAAMRVLEALSARGIVASAGEQAVLEGVARACLGSFDAVPKALWNPAEDRAMPRVARGVLVMVDGVRSCDMVVAAAQVPPWVGRVALAYLRAVGALRLG